MTCLKTMAYCSTTTQGPLRQFKVYFGTNRCQEIVVMITTTTMATIMTMIIINGTVAEIYQNMFLIDLQQNKKRQKKCTGTYFQLSKRSILH